MEPLSSEEDSDDKRPENDVADENPQSVELGFIKTPSLAAETTRLSSTYPPSSSIHMDLNQDQPQMLNQYSIPIKEGFENGLDEDGILKKMLNEEIQKVIYVEALNEAVMKLALNEVGEQSDGKRGRSGNVEENQGQNGNDELGSEYMEEEGEEEEEEEEEDEEVGIYFNGGNNYSRRFEYPLRIDAEDCAFYMKTGSCKFGMNCKFNHPPKRTNQGARDKAKPRAEDSEQLGQTECKYYLTPGGCKFGNACKYNHNRERSAVEPPVEFNFLGLPIRLGEKECPFYMRNGSCKYGSNCRFNHPDPTSIAGNGHTSHYGNGGSVSLHGAAQSTALSWSSAPMMFPPPQGIPSSPKWNGYQATVYPTSERSLPIPPAFAMKNPATETNFYAPHQQQMPVDEFPQRPGQPDCSYFLRTGDCKYKANCKFHHPKFQSSKSTSCVLSDKGLPLRPDQSICSYYNRYGICKFGPACKFDHPENGGKLVSSDGVRMARNETETGFS